MQTERTNLRVRSPEPPTPSARRARNGNVGGRCDLGTRLMLCYRFQLRKKMCSVTALRHSLRTRATSISGTTTLGVSWPHCVRCDPGTCQVASQASLLRQSKKKKSIQTRPAESPVSVSRWPPTGAAPPERKRHPFYSSFLFWLRKETRNLRCTLRWRVARLHFTPLSE